ncbi:cytochrome c oxidase assembly protein [Novosphingobium sp. TH158]|uniref:cytochrome c oxidase assembly protein n=1 Tax=Novosphingobium sp. TH158 TaxID=2067455 RepID=UPI000C7A46D4|nr:cytochrome c oxidase assembly protein [Novosphingobium sp. TH158]PLK26582.1 cytochrome c oxidase assembly protein [Novosphingobium sp. TH158]
MATAPVIPSPRDNRKVGLMAAGLALAMLGLGWASVPLYRLFCQVTGFGGTAQRVSEAEARKIEALNTTISVRFDGNVDKGLPWQFGPEQITQTVRLGARNMAIYTAKNTSSVPITGMASFNVSPDEAGKYFSKIQCFCFTQQTLKPGEEVRMPVTYYVDPAILEDDVAKSIKQITLSYTFHEDRTSAANSGANGLDRGTRAR